MDKTVIPFDLYRMFIGEHSPLFLLEIVFRTLVVWSYALLLLRWVGHRAVGQLTLIEFLLVIALGSAVGDAMFYPDVPLTHALLVITVVVLADKSLDWLAAKYKLVARYIDGKPVRIVEDGVIDYEAAQGAGVPLAEIHEQLRLAGVTNVGQVASAYVETNGHFSVFRKPEGEHVIGLPIVPPAEVEAPRVVQADGRVDGPRDLACRRCAAVTRIKRNDSVGVCPRCGSSEWVELEPPSVNDRPV